MQPNLLTAIILPVLGACSFCPGNASDIPASIQVQKDSLPQKIIQIPLPDGYQRISQENGSFGEWIRALSLKQDNTVYLYNGMKKPDQSAQYAVLNISVGKKDLQQCADAVMRLRAEYLFSQQRYSEISFTDNNGRQYKAPAGNSRPPFDLYLEKVFSYCGSASLEKQLNPVSGLSAIQPGDVLIKGGFPGHAAQVLDVAINKRGEKIFLLANSFMPAQSIHVLVNPGNKEISPWYSAATTGPIQLPEWVFYPSQLKRW